jgi:sirohydrochlorin cobaltochelatase
LPNAYLLVSHGSRDSRPQIAADQLAQQLRLQLASIFVDTAQLELAEQPLHLQVSEYALKCAELGISSIVILPLFLIPGVHVLEDLPAEITLAQELIGDRIQLTVAPFLGANADFAALFGANRDVLPSQSIILAHGSRKTGGNTLVEELASSLDLQAAYWSVSPSLSDQVNKLVVTGATEIGILPYFLFAGGITDAIKKLVSQLREQHPQVQLRLGMPIGNNPELVGMIGKILRSIENTGL